MAGVTDSPFRKLCLTYGAGMAVSEMMSANPKLWNTAKSQQRLVYDNEAGIRSVQIAGSDPALMADAAQYCAEQGAQIIDINMGCPAKKINRKLAGSALLQHPELIGKILTAVTDAVNIPVTLKTRTGWDLAHKNCLHIAQIAEQSGIQALALHGRTKACMYNGEAEYDSIREVKQAVQIPVIANGDISCPKKAKFVLDYTGADGLMIGRAAQGRPWIFAEIQHYLTTGRLMPEMPLDQVKMILIDHIKALHEFYGVHLGYRIARKHVGWYLKQADQSGQFRQTFNAIESAPLQIEALEDYFYNVAQ